MSPQPVNTSKRTAGPRRRLRRRRPHPLRQGRGEGHLPGTRADDLVVKCIRELMRRNPSLPPERIDEVAIAATTQTGDQGLTIGRTAALLAGLPQSVPGFAIDRMCAGAMTAVTTTAGSIAFGAYDVVIAGGVEHMGNHPMGAGADPNPRFVVRTHRGPGRPEHGQHRREPARPVPGHHQGTRRRLRRGLARKSSPPPTPPARSSRTWFPLPPRRPARAGPCTPPTSRRAPAPRSESWPTCAPPSAPTAGSPPATPRA